MRKRKYLIGAAAALTASIAVAAVAVAGPVSSQSIGVTVSSGAQDVKVYKKINSLDVNVDTVYTQPAPYTGKAILTKVYFPKDWKFNTKGLATCDKAVLAGTTTDAALAGPCGASKVGAGESTVTQGVITANGVVTAFNGLPINGRATILLHNRVGAPLNNTTVLEGILQPSDDPAYGQMLVVTVPILAGGFVITHFGTTIAPIPKLPAAKGSSASVAKKKKKKTPPQFYIMARCGKSKKWTFDARSTYDTGVTTNSTDVTVPCKQSKGKKKKK